MTTNPLVANVKSSTTWHTALGPVDDVASAAEDAHSGAWVSGMLDASSTVGDAAQLISDPIGTLVNIGLHWVIDHLEPFPTWLDHLTGSPDEIDSFAQTWHNVGGRIHQDAGQFRSTVAADTSPWSGPAVEAYRAATTVQSAVIDGFGVMCEGVAGAVQLAGSIVKAVRKMVEDTLCKIVSKILSEAWKFFTGVLIPDALAELGIMVSSEYFKVNKFVQDLIESMRKLSEVLAKLRSSIDDATKGIREVAGRLSDEEPKSLMGKLKEGTKESEKEAVVHTLETGSYQEGDPTEPGVPSEASGP